MRTIGGAFGAQIAAAIVTNHIPEGARYASESGYTTAFVMGAIAVAVATAAAALIPGRRPLPADDGLAELAHGAGRLASGRSSS
jgi:hypothetical protein